MIWQTILASTTKLDMTGSSAGSFLSGNVLLVIQAQLE